MRHNQAYFFHSFDSSFGRSLFMVTPLHHTAYNRAPFITVLALQAVAYLWKLLKLPHLIKKYIIIPCCIRSKDKITISMLLGDFWMSLVASDAAICVVTGLKTWGSTKHVVMGGFCDPDGSSLSLLFQSCFCNDYKIKGCDKRTQEQESFIATL